ncbi:M14 family metallocarboxypeptidase [Pseudoalteromonas sp. MMG005]|uniref:M14 family metallopeptidase n=1 Tax=Pseudoalteromonas sp. MMG005 TaxID=2822682 RepID=UPI001B3A6633|nr:M14 family metallocarboxypeptidase [Pseudoalteromonas sp. MMG005]MBQ4845958.1 M14 family metallocarboxypeptidase [Pseudoalteromonas sp. MMG005]
MSQPYSIGTVGTPWGTSEKQSWLQAQSMKRSYDADVVTKVSELSARFNVSQYGSLSYEHRVFDLFAIQSPNWATDKKIILITGGVHGYETSGVHGALEFLEQYGNHYSETFNLIVLPCLSPWGYETINRWNPDAIDPNRSFFNGSPAQESKLAADYLAQFQNNIICHIDLHETTDTDNSEFRPALAARDGITNHNWNIPDGFYLVGHTQKPEPNFQKSIIDEVAKVTHIAPADENKQLIGVPIEQEGVINYDGTKLGLCMGVTDAPYVTTTEAYPDSLKATPQSCIDGQVAAIKGALNYLVNLR